MGETISTLVFRPPPPTPIKPDKFFYIRIPKEDEHATDYQCTNTCGGMPPEIDIFDNFDSSYNNNSNINYKDMSNRDRRDMSTLSSLKGVASSTMCSGGGILNRTYENHYNNQAADIEYFIPAFFLRRKGAKVTILFSHGNAEDLGMMYRRMKEVAMLLCANVLAYDYTGYGLSKPHNHPPTEAMCYRNIVAAYNHLTQTMRIPPNEIILYGRSLGSGPSCYLAKKTADEGASVAGLILHSPFLSIYRIVLDCRVNLVGDMFINRSKAKDVRCPVLIIHGTKDDVVPFWHGDELLRSFPPQCRAQPYFVNGLGHNHIEVKRKEEYVRRINAYIDMYIINPIGRCTIKNQPRYIPEREQYKPEKTLRESGKFVVNQTWMKHGMAIVNEALQERKKKQTTPTSLSQPNPPSTTTTTTTATRTTATRTTANKSGEKLLNPLTPILRKQIRGRKETQDSAGSNNEMGKPTDGRKYFESTNLENRDAATKARHAQYIKTTKKLKEDNIERTIPLSKTDSFQSVQSAASRFTLTKESWGADDEDENVSFDDLKENNEKSNNGEIGVSLHTFVANNTSVISGFSLESTFAHDGCELSIRDIKGKIDGGASIASDKSGNVDESFDRYSIEGAV